MVTGNIMLDAIAFVAIGWAVAFLLVPLAQWIDYKQPDENAATASSTATRTGSKSPPNVAVRHARK